MIFELKDSILGYHTTNYRTYLPFGTSFNAFDHSPSSRDYEPRHWKALVRVCRYEDRRFIIEIGRGLHYLWKAKKKVQSTI
jgi:hypothetical protein